MIGTSMKIRMSFFGLFVVIFLHNFLTIRGARILLFTVNPVQKSHHGYVMAVGSPLLSRGHEIYSIIHKESGVEMKAKSMGIKPILYGSDNEIFPERKYYSNLLFRIIFENEDHDELIKYISEIGFHTCENVMNNKTLLGEIRTIGFDLVIYDSFVLAPCAAILPEHLNLPSIGISSAQFNWNVRNPLLPSFFPAQIPGHLTYKMTFFERLENLIVFAVTSTVQALPAVWQNTSMLMRFVADKNIVAWEELILRSDLQFTTRDELLEWPIPLMPHIVSVACVTCFPPKPLSKELEDIMTQSYNGVIILTFGSVIERMPDYILQKFIKAFESLKQNVLMAYKGNNLPDNLPKNILISKWLPQNDILGHPNTKLFITHCGNNGEYESLYHGVPMIGFPGFADQNHNALRMENQHFGIKMDLKTFTSEELVRAVNAIIGSNGLSEYTLNVKVASEKLKNRPISTHNKIVYWVEYILKYGGADMRSHAMNLSLIEFLMVDLLLFISISFVCVLFVLCFCCYWCVCVKRTDPAKVKFD